MSYESMDSLATVVELVFLPILIVVVVLLILCVIAQWKVFEKAGESGWKALIPFYSEFVMYKISWNTAMFWGMMALSLASGMITQNFAPESPMIMLSFLLQLISMAIYLIQNIKLSQSFDKGILFGICLLIFRPICLLILAFDRSEYCGPW